MRFDVMRNFSQRVSPRLDGLVLSLAIGILTIGLASQLSPVLAETESSAVRGFQTDPDAPIEIEADTLEVEQGSQTATFIGNVVAVQGTIRMASDRLRVHYAEQSDGTTSKTEITRIRATGNVHVMSEDDQSADGEWALYEVASEVITMGDAVVLRQGENVIRGQGLTINLQSGQARVDGGVNTSTGTEGGSGRVRGLFQAPQQ